MLFVLLSLSCVCCLFVSHGGEESEAVEQVTLFLP